MQRKEISKDDNAGLISSLVGVNMNAMAHSLMTSRNTSADGAKAVDITLKTAMKLEQWDVRVPETANSDIATLYRIYQSINNATSMTTVRKDMDAGFLRTITSMLDASLAESTFKSRLNTLGVLCELDDVVTSLSAEHLQNAWQNAQHREASLISAR